MPLFLIPRNLRPGMSEEERELLMAMVISAGTWFPDVKWQRSYAVDEPDRVLSWCAYRGPTHAQVSRHAIQCGAPFERVTPVEEWLPAEGTANKEGLAKGYLLVERTFGPEVRGSAAREMLQGSQELAKADGLTWVRSFWSEDQHRSWCVLTGDDAELARDHARKSGLPCDAVELVLENHPSHRLARLSGQLCRARTMEVRPAAYTAEWGNFDWSPLTASSPEIVIVARPRSAADPVESIPSGRRYYWGERGRPRHCRQHRGGVRPGASSRGIHEPPGMQRMRRPRCRPPIPRPGDPVDCRDRERRVGPHLYGHGRRLALLPSCALPNRTRS